MNKLRSNIWDYFERSSDGLQSKCIICDAVLKSKGATTSLWNHLRFVHGAEAGVIATLENMQRGSKRNRSDSDKDAHVEIVNSEVRSTQCSSTLPRISERRSRVSNAFEDRPVSSERTELITQAAAQMIIINQLPISFIDSKGFELFMKVVEPNYKIPCKRMVLNRINLSYNEKRNCVERKLATAESIAIDTDSWTSLSMTSYITVNAHYLNSDWQKQSYNLITEEMNERHTIANLLTKLRNVTDEGKITEKVLGIVTDNASNITGAVDALDCEGGVRCFAHTLQLSVQKGLKLNDVKEVLDKASSVVLHFRHSAIATDALHVRQKQLGLPEHKLMQRCVTRWNSDYYMAMTIVKNKSAINTVLGDRSITKQSVNERLHLSDMEWKILEALIIFLKPLEMATTLMCSDKCCTLSMMRPLVRSLLDAHLVPQDEDDPIILSLKLLVAIDVTRRFEMEWKQGQCIVKHEHIASALDPRYKDLKHEENEARQQIWATLKCKLMTPDEDNENMNESPNSDEQEYENPLDFLFKKKSLGKSSTQQQFANFRKEPEIEHNADSLKWWKLNENKFPFVAKLAKCYLNIPATSSSAERVFSTAGNIVSAKRSCLHPKNVNKLVFLYQNRNVV